MSSDDKKDDRKKDKLNKEVRNFMEHSKKRNPLAPAASTAEWEAMIDASDRTPEEKEHAKELGRFLSLKQYIEDKNEQLAQVVLDGFLELYRFPSRMQITWLRNTNHRLMEQIGHAGPRA